MSYEKQINAGYHPTLWTEAIIYVKSCHFHRLFLFRMSLDEDSGVSGSCGNGKLRQWLIDQIDSRKYPGLVWENAEKSIFRVPWKHAGKQDYNREEDAALFKVGALPPACTPQMLLKALDV